MQYSSGLFQLQTDWKYTTTYFEVIWPYESG